MDFELYRFLFHRNIIGPDDSLFKVWIAVYFSADMPQDYYLGSRKCHEHLIDCWVTSRSRCETCFGIVNLPYYSETILLGACVGSPLDILGYQVSSVRLRNWFWYFKI